MHYAVRLTFLIELNTFINGNSLTYDLEGHEFKTWMVKTKILQIFLKNYLHNFLPHKSCPRMMDGAGTFLYYIIEVTLHKLNSCLA